MQRLCKDLMFNEAAAAQAARNGLVLLKPAEGENVNSRQNPKLNKRAEKPKHQSLCMRLTNVW